MKNKKMLVFTVIASMTIGATCLYPESFKIPVKAETQDVSSGITRSKGEVMGTGLITLEDAQETLKAALGIITLTGEKFWAADLNDDNSISLNDAQIILKVALGIVRIEEVVPQSTPTPSPVCNTGQPQTTPTSTPIYNTETPQPIETTSVPPMVLNESDRQNIVIAILENYGIRGDEALIKNSGISDQIKITISEYFKSKYGTVIKYLSWEELEQQGYKVPDPNYYWVLTKPFYQIDSVIVESDSVIVSSGVSRGGLNAAFYKTTLKKVDEKWVIVKDECYMVS